MNNGAGACEAVQVLTLNGIPSQVPNAVPSMVGERSGKQSLARNLCPLRKRVDQVDNVCRVDWNAYDGSGEVRDGECVKD